MNRTEAEAYLASEFATVKKVKSVEGKPNPKQLDTGEFEYVYAVKAVLGDECVNLSVKLTAETIQDTAESFWDKKTPTNPLSVSVKANEDQIKSWVSGHVDNFCGILPITKSQLSDYPRWVVVPCLVESGGEVKKEVWYVRQESAGGSVTKTPYVEV